MTLNERYIQLVIPYLAAAEGSSVEPKQFKDGLGWVFPCPFCSSKHTKSYKKSNRVGALIPNQSIHTFVFCCSRKQSPECSANRLFPNFLKMLNPDLFRKYHQEREERSGPVNFSVLLLKALFRRRPVLEKPGDLLGHLPHRLDLPIFALFSP